MKKVDLTEGKVIKVLTLLALPIMGSSLLQFAYNIIDMLWVGGLGSNAVASIGSSSFFLGLGYAINALVVTGCGIKVAHSLGRKDELDAKKYINSGLIINLVIGIIYMSLLVFWGKGLIGFLKLDNKEVFDAAYAYLAISGPTILFNFYNTLYIRILGSFGNNKDALKISALGLILNIILDPIFIYGLKLGVKGAAISTLIANLVMFILFRFRWSEVFKYDRKLKIDFNKIKEIIALGLPMSFQRVLFTLINIVLARIIAQYGSDAIAAQKIGLQIESITYMVVGGFQGAVASFTGQNFGAMKKRRILEGYNSSLIIGVIYSICMTFILLFFNKPIIKLFVSERETILIASSYLKIIAFSQIFSTVETVSNGLFTGLGMPKIPATISIVFTALRIPMALFFINFLALNGVWLSICLSSILKGIVAYFMYIMKVRKEYKNVKET